MIRDLLIISCLVTSSLSAAKPFNPDDRWIAIGDSISTNGMYAQNIELFYLTRFPSNALDYANAGIPGDTGAGVLHRFEWDIASTKPTVATVMLGMNDVGRGNYEEDQNQAEMQPKRTATLAKFEENLREITARLQGIGSRVVLLSPTPFDDTSRMAGKNLPGCNDALAELGRSTRRIATESGAEFIDVHTPMTLLNRRLQEKSPEFTLIGGDRIHPGQPGHFAAAYYFLQAQDVRGTVAIAHLDAKTSGIRRAENCTISELTGTDRKFEFTYLPDSLPFPVPTGAIPALEWVPFQSELNREELRVQGLAAGNYQLKIDEQDIATLDAADLARGVNLALLPTPQLVQSQKVLKIMEERWALIGKLRIIAMVENSKGRELPRPITLEAMEPALAAWEVELAATPDHWQITQPMEYRKAKPTANDITQKSADLLVEARAAARPVPRRIALTLVQN